MCLIFFLTQVLTSIFRTFLPLRQSCGKREVRNLLSHIYRKSNEVRIVERGNSGVTPLIFREINVARGNRDAKCIDKMQYAESAEFAHSHIQR